MHLWSNDFLQEVEPVNRTPINGYRIFLYLLKGLLHLHHVLGVVRNYGLHMATISLVSITLGRLQHVQTGLEVSLVDINKVPNAFPG